MIAMSIYQVLCASPLFEQLSSWYACSWSYGSVQDELQLLQQFNLLQLVQIWSPVEGAWLPGTTERASYFPFARCVLWSRVKFYYWKKKVVEPPWHQNGAFKLTKHLASLLWQLEWGYSWLFEVSSYITSWSACWYHNWVFLYASQTWQKLSKQVFVFWVCAKFSTRLL
jgi:hypothetical protein